MSFFFDKHGDADPFSNGRRFRDGEYSDNIIDQFGGDFDYDNVGGISQRGFYDSSGNYVIERNGKFLIRIDPMGTIFEADTGEYLGKLSSGTIFDSQGSYLGKVPSNATKEQSYLVISKIFGN